MKQDQKAAEVILQRPRLWSDDAGLAGKSVLITGAASGVGAAMMRGALRAEMHVLAADIDTVRLEDSAHDALKVSGAPITQLSLQHVDLANLDDVAVLVAAFRSTDQPSAGLLHAAALMLREYDIAQIGPEDWQRQVDVNQRATWFLNRGIAEALKARSEPGAIVNTGSVGAYTGGIGGSWVYAATKGAVLSITRGMARTYAADGIRVNAINPGPVLTPMLTKGLAENTMDQVMAAVPLGRIADPAEIAEPALFLMSRHASFITGVNLDVDGGWLMR